MLEINMDKDAQKNTKDMEENLSNENLYPLKIDLTFSVIDFIDMEEFNSKQITAKDYKKELDNFLMENSIVNKDFAKNICMQLQDKGFHLISTSVSSSKFDENSLTKERIAMLFKNLKSSLLDSNDDEE